MPRRQKSELACSAGVRVQQHAAAVGGVDES